MPSDICCPRCGKVLGEMTEEYIQFGKERNRVYEPVCHRAIELTCPGILGDGSKCRLTFTLNKASCRDLTLPL